MIAAAPLHGRLARWPAALARRRGLVVHLAARQLRATHRRTALGWVWPLGLQLVQLAVLSFVFQRVIPLDIDNYPAFVLSGLVFWSWLRGAFGHASTSVTDNAPLVLEPRTPMVVLPLVAISVATFDLLIALPVLLVLVAVTDGIHPTWALLPVVLAVQATLMAGVGMMLAAAHVYVRDVAQAVGVGLLFLFYLTPVFYPLDAVPGGYRWIFDLNPAASLIEIYRGLLIDGTLPELARLGGLALAACALAVVGWIVFRRLEGGFADEL